VRFLGRAVLLACSAVLVLFAVSNRETVSLALWPLPFLVDVPLYFFFFLSLLVGALIGGLAAWFAGGRVRRESRRRRRRIQALERELAATQSQLPDHSGVPPMVMPSAPASRL
jgi:lipopolysaccharide assembly protein A